MRMVSAEERFMQAYALLMNVANAELQANPEMTLSAAGGTKRVLQQIAALVRRFGDMERLCVSLAMKVFRWLLDARVRLLVETHVVLWSDGESRGEDHWVSVGVCFCSSIEQAVQGIVAENLDTACAIIVLQRSGRHASWMPTCWLQR
jgi:hypothetical protein